ncbi:discoidin domain-containing protein [Dactylosporangium sp. AC04546]|uniref:discoidin domain-containing protein n=1 Tax=Dactylosporangium sp. AC04546 TaxID=2862460 RepID=UPI001EE0F565|nr:discoidin domain-containing protein [Dactylosporangium sp. AC04546]WVK86405.1 discoidin domain-containing protein [Dactylosporangium sp. AC04546]
MRTAVPPTALRHRRRTLLIAAVATFLLLATYAVTTTLTANAADTLISQGKPALSSSDENGGTPASAAVDGNTTGTRWSSAAADPQWLRVDLGATASISQVKLYWETAYATAFKIQTSPDGNTWTDIKTVTGATGGTQTYDVTGSGRYVRMYGTARATGYGYSLWEFQVYGSFGTDPTAGPCNTAVNAAQGRPADASSTENAGANPASAAVDGNAGTRWSSVFSDPQWLRVDLGSVQSVCQVTINWEAAYGKDFQIQTSTDNANWTTIKTVTGGTGGNQVLSGLSGSGRWLRVYGTARGSGYGYSIWELVVNVGGTAPTSNSPSPSTSPSGPQLPGGGDLGSNVIVFDPSMSSASIQAKLDEIFTQQEQAQFGPGRYQFLFKPGTYNGLNAQIGFYTSINGLGQNPQDVKINGDITVDAGWFGGNATQNFWRSAENLSIYPVNGVDRWAVAQAAPFRRIDVHGGMTLASPNCGWASGGYIADSRISGNINPCSQQQWFTRDSTIGSWNGSVWNMVFSGVQGAPATSFPNPPYTTVAQSPISQEKPYLYADASGAYRVFVPSLRTNSSGATWINGQTPGTSLSINQFYVAKPGVTAATLNQAVAQGLNLLFTPGVYHLNQTVNINRANTVVLGLGYATIVADNGALPMQVGDVDGVKIASLLFDAGPTNSPALLQVGPAGATGNHAANPNLLSDVFLRVGGAGAAKVTNALVVNNHNTIIDHIWSWRADHGDGAGWTTNPADTGLVVNGNNVMAYGLFVEHFNKYNVIWNGNGGRTIFFQNELPYDPPSAAAWSHDGIVGYAAYKVANNVTSHEAWGLGSYCVFTSDPSIAAYHSFEVPVNPNVKFHSVLTVSLGKGSITHVINDTGPAAQASNVVPSNVVSFP